jgi:outer membrane protein OmpA-like peptidoglycan-associated protein
MFRVAGAVVAAPIAIGLLASADPAAAQSCQSYFDRVGAAVTHAPLDVRALDNLRNQVGNSIQCNDTQKTCVARLIADAFAGEARQKKAQGAPQKDVEALAAAAASIAPTSWQVLWTLGNLEEAKKDYDKAAFYYGAVLTELKEAEDRLKTNAQGGESSACAGERESLPSRQQVVELFQSAYQASALAKSFVSPPPTREGLSGGIFVGPIRGIDVTRYPTPVEFKYDSVELTPKGVDAARFLFNFINGRNATRVVLTGHADQKGSDEYNCQLSRRRLDALGVMLNRDLRDKKVVIELVPQGKGEPVTIAPGSNLTKDQIDQVNRRIELRDRPQGIVRKCT